MKNKTRLNQVVLFYNASTLEVVKNGNKSLATKHLDSSVCIQTNIGYHQRPLLDQFIDIFSTYYV